MRRREQEERNLAGRAYVLAQLRQTDLGVLIRTFLAQRELPAAAYHYASHGAAMGCDSEAAYLARFSEALGRFYAEFFVVRQSAVRPRLMWYAIDKASGEVLQFNQQSGQVQSFYLSASWEMLVKNTQAVRVWLDGDLWRIEE